MTSKYTRQQRKRVAKALLKEALLKKKAEGIKISLIPKSKIDECIAIMLTAKGTTEAGRKIAARCRKLYP